VSTETTPKAQPLSEKREAIVRQNQIDGWLPGAWLIREATIDNNDETSDGIDVWQVTRDGTVLATLPDWAGNLALWIAETHDDIPELLATIDQARAERDGYKAEAEQMKDRVAELEAIAANAKKLSSQWKQTSNEHVQISHMDAIKANPHIAGIQQGRADQYADCANELDDVLSGENPDEWEHGVAVEVGPVETAEAQP
jgi:hypothetical protein